jgi:hypothetical protein
MTSVYAINIYKRQSLTKSIMVTYFMFYLLWSCLESSPDTGCNNYANRTGSKVAQILLHNLGFIFTFVSLSI